MQRGIDLATWSAEFGVSPAVAGERLHFQIWHRDAGGLGAGSNFSDSWVVLLR